MPGGLQAGSGRISPCAPPLLEIPGSRGACHRAALRADPLARPRMTAERESPRDRDLIDLPVGLICRTRFSEILLFRIPNQPLYSSPSRPTKRGVGHRH
jgi:hypothetical protein